jgi:hypothetical protein
MIAAKKSMERKKMTWGKVDDNLAFHPKVIAAGNEAMGLWVRSLSWSSQQLTDGIIPDAIISALHGEASAHILVAAGLWHEVDGGYEFNDWVDYQPTREQVLAERHATRERSRAARAKASAARNVTDVTERPAASTDTATRRPSRIPPSFSIKKEMRDWAQTELPYFDVDKETLVFVDYWTGKATNATKLDWEATWRNWMRKAFTESPVSKIGQEIAPEIRYKMDAERQQRTIRQLEEREAAEKLRAEQEPIPECKHGKSIISCVPCSVELAAVGAEGESK